MKPILKIPSFFILTLLLFTISCSKDDNPGGGSGINAQNLVTNFDENPADGASVATIQAVSDNTLNYSITSQTPSGAMSINSNTGELKVANASLFDFETNPVISAVISIIDPSNTTSATATINLNNLDDIESFLSTSKAAYTSASDGNWIGITEAEYNTLATRLNEVTKVATTDAQYNTPGSAVTVGMAATFVDNNGVTMPANSFVFAIKYKDFNNTGGGIKVKQSSTNVTSGYTDLGGTLSSATDNHYVLKGNNTAVPAVGYLAIYDPDGYHIRLQGSAGNQVIYDAGDTNSVSSILNDLIVLYQGLSTTQKQW